MLVQNLENKIRTVTIVAVATVVAAALITIIAVFLAFSMVQKERSQVYVLSNGIPLLAQRLEQQQDMMIETKSHIDMFHSYFFNLAPDDEYIEWTIKKALYLIDESGMRQRKTLIEKGFYQNVISSSAVLSLITDSIKVNLDSMSFTYWGKQHIERPSSKTIRSLVTKGKIKRTKRTPNNPHGMIIYNWRTIENNDLKYIRKNI